MLVGFDIGTATEDVEVALWADISVGFAGLSLRGELFADGLGVHVLVCILMPLILMALAKLSKGGRASSGTIIKRKKG